MGAYLEIICVEVKNRGESLGLPPLTCNSTKLPNKIENAQR
jgi:hypothetical protein